MSLKQEFDKHAAEYDQLRRKFIPCFDDFYAAALAWLPRPQYCGDQRAIPMLELGAGTGLLSAMVLEAIPCAHVTMVDMAPQMLEQARARLAGLEERFQIIEADYLRDELPGPFRAVFSALSIHHLEDPDKRRLFAKLHGLLGPGGVLVNADQIAGASPRVQEFQQELWLRQILQAGITPAQMALARQRMAYDRPSPLREQLDWLEEAGFVDVDCLYRYYGFAVYVGRKPEAA